jgi:NAD(P)-dependent dehydrogenase (short-subunit alcohol dehydrogenase family)
MKCKTVFIGGTSAVGQSLRRYFLDAEYLSSKQFDVTRPKDYDADIVVNLAAITQDNDLSQFNILTSKSLAVNCLGAINTLAIFLPGMRQRKYGRIIFMSSIYSVINIRGQGVYSASKAFVDKLIQVAALENAQYGITVNSIQLGYTGVGMGDVSDDLKQKALSKTGLKRFVTPKEIADTINYIISTEYLTGQNILLGGCVK